MSQESPTVPAVRGLPELIMPVEDETRRTLNLIRNAPETAVHVERGLKAIRIVSPRAIEPYSGVFWLYGLSELETGIELETVFVIDTGRPISATSASREGAHKPRIKTYYWWILDNWYPQGDFSGLRRLDIGEEEPFPFFWSTNIPLTMAIESGPQYRQRSKQTEFR